MTKRSATKIGPRDMEILIALDRCPLTVVQLLSLSKTFGSPFHDGGNLRRRLRSLATAGLVNSWPYAMAADGQSPKYFKLSRDGFHFLYDDTVATPRKRYFEEVSHGHHRHTHALAEVIVRTICTAHEHGIEVRHFARENSVRIKADGFTLYPDCAFQLVTHNNHRFNFVVELDNGSERIRTARDVESIERKIRGYDAHQSQFNADDSRRYLVLFVTTRSDERLKRMLHLAGLVMQNAQRRVFVGCNLKDLLQNDPFENAILADHRGLHRTMIPRTERWKAKEDSATEQAVDFRHRVQAPA